jgi:hypothetical protein
MLIAAADAALYQAKSLGRDRVLLHPLLNQLSRSVEINITGFSDWGLGIGDWELGIGKPYPVTSHQSPVPRTLSRQLVFNYA